MEEQGYSGWEIKVCSLGGAEDQPQERWEDAIDNADREITAKDAGNATGDAWIDRHAPARASVQKSSIQKSDDGGPQDLGRIEPDIIRVDENKLNTLFSGVGVIPPAISFAWLGFIVRNSPSIRQNIEAYNHGIDAHGYQLMPRVDLASEKVDDEIRAVIYMERLHEARVKHWTDGGDPPEVQLEIDDSEVDARKKRLKLEMAAEQARLRLFFDNPNPKETLIRIRRRLRWDLETYGNGFLAINRNPWGEPLSLWWVPARTTRAVKLSPEDMNVEVSDRVKISPVSYDKVKVIRSFRRYVQGIGEGDTPAVPNVYGGGMIFFKEIGDPRLIGNRTGQTYKTKAELDKAIKMGTETGPALEMIHFTLINTEHDVYGVPRWQGLVVGALGEIEAEQVNLMTLRNDAIPDLMILVEGGRFAAGAVEKIEKHLKTKLKGHNRTSGILTLEAAPSGVGRGSPVVGDAPIPKIHVIPLTQYQRDDALYVRYRKDEGDKIDSAFGNPPMSVGKFMGMNRATATVMADHVEKHTYEPERKDIDDVINIRLLPIFGARYWDYRSNAPINRDSRELIELADVAVRAGFLTLDEARLIAADALNHSLPPYDSEWSKLPLPVYLAQMKGVTGAPGAMGTSPEGVGKAIDFLAQKRASGGVSREDVLGFLSDLRSDMLEQMNSLTKQATLMGIDEHILRDSLGRLERGDGEKIEVDANVLKEWVMLGGRAMPSLGSLR